MEAVRLPDPQRMYASYPRLLGGQRQHVVFTTLVDPALLIADEPTTALDVTTQAQILKLIAEVQQRRGTGVLFITHDFGVVAGVADRVVVMQKEGNWWSRVPLPRCLRDRPAQPYTRMLIDAVSRTSIPQTELKTQGRSKLETVKLVEILRRTPFDQEGRRVHAVNSVDLRLRAGETLGIVGESAPESNRCTLYSRTRRSIVRCDHYWRSGRCKSSRKAIAGPPPAQIVFQDPYRSLNPRRTVGASIVEGQIGGTTRQHPQQRAS